MVQATTRERCRRDFCSALLYSVHTSRELRWEKICGAVEVGDDESQSGGGVRRLRWNGSRREASRGEPGGSRRRAKPFFLHCSLPHMAGCMEAVSPDFSRLEKKREERREKNSDEPGLAARRAPLGIHKLPLLAERKLLQGGL